MSGSNRSNKKMKKEKYIEGATGLIFQDLRVELNQNWIVQSLERKTASNFKQEKCHHATCRTQNKYSD